MLLAAFVLASPSSASELRVRVVDEAGQAVPGARVAVWSEREELSKIGEATTTSKGIARVAARTDSPLRVVVTTPGFRPIIQRVDGSSLESRREPLTIVLSTGRALRLRVVDAVSGEPVTQYGVIAAPVDLSAEDTTKTAFAMDSSPPQTVSSPDGVGRIRGLGDEPVTLAVLASGFAVGLVESLTLADDLVVVELDPRGCVERRVVDADTGGPLQNVRVVPATFEDVGTARDAARALSLAISDAEGRLTLCRAGVTAAADRVLLLHPAYAPRAVPVPGPDESGRSDDPVELERGGGLRVLVQTHDGLPVASARVVLTASGLTWEGRTKQQGTASFDGLSPDPDAELGIFLRGAWTRSVAFLCRSYRAPSARSVSSWTRPFGWRSSNMSSRCRADPRSSSSRRMKTG